MKLPWFIPRYREVLDDPSEERAALLKAASASSSKESISGIGSDENSFEKGKELVIREYRDEANRPWWKFFDEFEYRLTTETEEKQEWWRFRWFDKTLSAAESKLLLKLDLTVGVYALLGYWIKYLDSANLNNAYVTGLKEDIGMKGNDLIDTQVIFLVGNIIFELPWLFLLPRVPLPYVLFGAEIIWSLFTLITFKVYNPAMLKAFRFIVGSAEAPFFVIFHYSAASWYKPKEIGSIGAIFYCGQFIGVLTSGLLQGAASTIKGSLSGWQYMFIIDGSISFFVAILTLFLQPGTPSKCYSIWFTDDEIRLARRRMAENGTDMSHSTKSFFDKQTWKNILTSWHFWVLSFAQMFGFNTNNTASGSFALWLKSLNRYTPQKLNNLTTIPPALGLIWIMIVCVGADITGKRFGMIIFSYIMNSIANIILAVWNVPERAKWAGYYLSYWSWSQSSVFNPLISDILRHDSNQRAIEWMIIYILGLQSSAWVQRLTFPTTDAPRFKAGFTSCAVFSIAAILCLIVAYFFYKRDERKKALKNGIYLYNSKTGEIPPAVRSVAQGSSTVKQYYGVQETPVSEFE
ncbi:major facilitator superfamily domain-containing protein [Scheffersomyces xylosifermentans]|uniref:major facilitator superfamily domain-containing protein n=1 Tax=Scheffersomyces xylosifermentans TaxID=1304137 RepID=UPI00315C7274